MDEIKDDEWVMYLVIRESLNMSPGKIGAQAGHAVEYICDKKGKLWEILLVDPFINEHNTSPEDEQLLNDFTLWQSDGHRKVVLRADDKEWLKLKAEMPDHFLVKDSGATEVPAGSETCLGFWPMLRSKRTKSLKRLQVLK